MTIKQGGVFGRNPTFNTVTTQGSTALAGPLTVNAVGADRDTQIGTLAGPYSFFMDGTNGAVGFGTNSVTPYFGTTAKLYGASGGTLQVAGPSITAGFFVSNGLGFAALETVTAHDLRIATNSTERVRIGATSGNVTIANGNLVMGTAGTGIDFSATAGTGTSELFNDYEEGTWSPVVTPGTGTFTTVTAQTCTYTKVGRAVTISGRFTLTSSGTGAGAMTITGLPFVVAAAYDQNTFTGRIVNSGTPIFGQFTGTVAGLDSLKKIDGTTAIVDGAIYTLTATYTV